MIKAFLLCFTLGFLPLASAQDPIVPLGPVELIKHLPSLPQEWAVKESGARSYYVDWMFTRASRTLSFIPPATTENGVTLPVLPQVTRLVITDTGFWQPLMGLFNDFKPGKFGAEESFLMDSMPARRTPLGENFERVSILVNNRFIIQIDVENQPADAALKWAKLFNYANLSQVPDSGPRTIPRPIILEKINELNPKLNSKSSLQWVSDEELTAAEKAVSGD